MKFGPFSEAQATQVESILAKRGAKATRTHSQSDVEGWRERENAKLPTKSREFPEILQSIYLEVNETDIAESAEELEKFGIMLAGDGEAELGGAEDYVCPKCSFSALEPQLCPKHKLPLITFSEKVAREQAPTDPRSKMILLAILAGLAMVGYYWLSR